MVLISPCRAVELNRHIKHQCTGLLASSLFIHGSLQGWFMCRMGTKKDKAPRAPVPCHCGNRSLCRLVLPTFVFEQGLRLGPGGVQEQLEQKRVWAPEEGSTDPHRSGGRSQGLANGMDVHLRVECWEKTYAQNPHEAHLPFCPQLLERDEGVPGCDAHQPLLAGPGWAASATRFCVLLGCGGLGCALFLLWTHISSLHKNHHGFSTP